MSSVERRRLLCAILFHLVAAICVVWSLFVLIDRAAEEVQKGLIAWPFWTKLVVVAVGFTGGAVFMYIQCRQYLDVFSRWKAHNRIILVQNAPEKLMLPPPSPHYYHHPHQTKEGSGGQNLLSQVVTHAEYNVPPASDPNSNSQSEVQMCYVFDNKFDKQKCYSSSCSSSIQKADVHVEDLCDSPKNDLFQFTDERYIRDNLRHNIVALDIECPQNRRAYCQPQSFKTEGGATHKSLPNLISTKSSENLLV